MAVAKVKKKEHENLTEANIAKVIGLLEGTPPITKKEACEILNISYNTTRLAKIIDEYKDEKATQERLRAANKGKPIQPFEVQSIIEGYLEGLPVSKIADRLYRPASIVTRVIEDVGVPTKGESYIKPEALPDACIVESLDSGQIVWASRYNALAIVLDYVGPNRVGLDIYAIYVIESIDDTSESFFRSMTDYGGFHANQVVCDLGSLEHLKNFGVDVYKPYRPYFKEWLKGR
jgi:hypothetical protein